MLGERGVKTENLHDQEHVKKLQKKINADEKKILKKKKKNLKNK